MLLPIEDMAEAKLVLTDALIAEALRRGKQAERADERQRNTHRQVSRTSNPARHPDHRNDFQRASGEDRHRAQHEGE